MAIGERGFVEFIINKIKEEGIATTGFSSEEVEDHVANLIWQAYEEWEG